MALCRWRIHLIPDSDPTADDYINIGTNIPTIISNTESLNLLNDIIKTKEKVDIDTVPEIEDLANSVKDIIDVASGNKENITPNTIINDLNKFGITANGGSIKNLDLIQQQRILDAIRATDDNGKEVNTKQKLQDIVNNTLKDITPPPAPIITSDEYTTEATPLITGTAESGSTITISLGSATYITTTSSDGIWSIDTKSVMPIEGTFQTITEIGIDVLVIATDSSSNKSLPTSQILKAVAPALISGYEDNIGIIQSTSSTELVTDDTTPSFKIGILPTSAKNIILYTNETSILADYDPIKGTLTPTIPLADGIYKFKYDYTLNSKKMSSDFFTLTIDTKAPIISIDEISIDNMINMIEKEEGVIVSGITDAEEGQSVTIVWGNTTKIVTVHNGTWNANFISSEIPADGITTVIANVIDKAGNISIQGNKTVVIDTVAPNAPINAISSYEDNIGDIQDPVSTQVITDDTKPGFNIGSLPVDVEKAILYVDGIKVNAIYDPIKGTLTPVDNLTNGLHSITYAYADKVGNISAETAPFVI